MKHRPTVRDDRRAMRRLMSEIQSYWHKGTEAPAGLLLELRSIRVRSEQRARRAYAYEVQPHS